MRSAPLRLADAEADRDPTQYAVPGPQPDLRTRAVAGDHVGVFSRTRASPVRRTRPYAGTRGMRLANGGLFDR